MKQQLLTIALFMAAIPAFSTGVAPGIKQGDNSLREGKVETVTLGGKTYKLGNVRIPGTRDDLAPVTEVIFEAQGTEKLYNKEAAGTFVLNGGLDQYWDDFPVSVVWGDDNTVYFKDIISTSAFDTYVKGTVNGNTITIPTNQTVIASDEEDAGLNLGIIKTQIRGEYVDFYYDPTFTEFTITVQEDGGMTLNLPGEPFDGMNPPQYVLGYYYTDDLSFYGFSDYFQTYTPMNQQPVTMPEGKEPQTYVFIDEFNYAEMVDVVFDGNDLYIRGLTAMLPEGVVKATIKGTTATIPQNEFLGVYMDAFFIYTKVLYDNPFYNETDPNSSPFVMAPADATFNLTIDNENKTIVADTQGVYLSFQPDEDTWENSITVLSQFILRYQASAAGTPAPASDLSYSIQWAPIQGWNDFFFTLSNYSTEGMIIDVENLYYGVYINGEPLIFGEQLMKNLNGEEVTVYPSVPSEQRWIPYHFNNNEDLFKLAINQFDVGIYRSDVITIGVQTLYYFEGTTTYSDIVTLNIQTGEVSTSPAGVKAITNDSPVKKTEYYSIDGLRIYNPGSGIYILRETHDDGTVTTRKVAKRY